ncbi:MAG: beta-ketoacyl-ACP synthase, partial [Burkholderiales bacterium]|nr:beta-ketoacyl-ACP synthase [Burkholderiales bacterium]
MSQPLAFSACSIVTCLGAGRAATLRALVAGRSGLAPCTFETVQLDTWIGQVPGVDDVVLPASLAAYDCRNNRLAQMALHTDDFAARVEATKARIGAARIGVFVGTSTSGILQTELAYRQRSPDGALPAGFHYAETHNTFSLADFVRRSLGVTGPSVVVSAACASSAKVFGNAARAIAAGIVDAAVVGGVDSLCLTTLYGFASLGLTAPRPCRPWDRHRDGISIAEGAAFVLLEPVSAAPARIRLTGVGESSDAYHMSTPHPEGAGARRALRAALVAAGRNPVDVDYVNLHGTGSRSNDASEDLAVYGELGGAVAASSTKGLTGHALGATGGIEAIITALAL